MPEHFWIERHHFPTFLGNFLSRRGSENRFAETEGGGRQMAVLHFFPKWEVSESKVHGYL
jgi:hypothetical protein